VARQLQDQLRTAIQSGALAAGSELPSTRVLSEDLEISRGVVVSVYGRLASEGYIEMRQGAIPKVRATSTGQLSSKPAPATARGQPILYDLRPHLPEVGTFPRRQWANAVRGSLDRARDADLSYTDAAGLWELRVEVANYLSRARGVIATPERVVITAGTSHALSLISRSLTRRGKSRMAFEDPSHAYLRDVAEWAGQTIVPIAVDDDGIDPSEIGEVDSLFVTPANQFPTGVALTSDRQRELIKWGQRSGGLIIQDDYDAEFRYERAPTRALQGLGPEEVVYLGSTGTTLTPALRLGWAVLPSSIADDIARELFATQHHISGLDQLAFSSFLQRGDYDRHLYKIRRVYRRRRVAVIAALAKWFPSSCVRGIAAGLHVVVSMPSHRLVTAVQKEAAELGVYVESIGQHARLPERVTPGIIVGFGSLSEPSLERAIELLGAAAATVGANGGSVTSAAS
jgi:GntR family transcriptional regulator / MocR family aminotransferase